MRASHTHKGHWLPIVAEILVIMCLVGLLVQAEDKNKKSSSPPR